MKKECRFSVTGMSCAACVGHVEKAARELPEVEEAEANLLSYTLTVRFREEMEE